MRRLLFLPIVLGLATAVAAADAASRLSAANQIRNGKISFWSDRALGGRAQVFVMRPNGSRQRRLTNLFSAKRGDFSADGKRLVLDGRARDTLDDFDIFVISAVSKSSRRYGLPSRHSTSPGGTHDPAASL